MGLRRLRKFLGILAFVLGVAAAAAPAPQMAARCLSNRYLRRGGVVPLVVDIKCADVFRGRLVITVERWDGMGRAKPTARLETNMDVGRGQFHYEIPITPGMELDGDQVEVELIADSGKTIARQTLQNWDVPANDAAMSGAAPFNDPFNDPFGSRQEVAFDPFSTTRPPGQARPQPPRGIAWISTRTVNIPLATYPEAASWWGVPLRAADLPADWRLYQAFDTVVVGHHAATMLTGSRLTALLDWVRAGGEIVVGGDAIPVGFEDSDLARALDLRVGASAVPFGPEGLRGLPFAVGDGAPELRAYVLRDLGVGRVIHTSYEFGLVHSQRPIVLTALRDLLVADLAVDRIRPYPGRQFVLPCLRQTEAHDWRDRRGIAWQYQLRDMTGLEPISPWVIGGFIVLFVLLVTVVERFVLARFHRLTWSWWTTLVVVVVFCLAANQLSRATRGFRPRMAMIGFHDYGPGGGRHFVAGCFIPSTARPFVLQPAPAPLPTLLAVGGEGVVHCSLGTGEAEQAVPVWDTAPFAAVVPHREPPPFVTDLKLDDYRRATGTCRLRAPLKVLSLGLWHDNVLERFARDGDTWTVFEDHMVRISLPAATLGLLPGPCRNSRGMGMLDIWWPPVDLDGVWLIAIVEGAPLPVATPDGNPQVTTFHIIRQSLPDLDLDRDFAR